MNLYNEIKSHFELPNAFADWTNYRNTLTNYLIAQTDQITLPLSFFPDMKPSALLPTLAIIGAGACNDLDLKALSAHFSKITLIDYDSTAMNKAISTYHLENSSVIELFPISLNGLNDSDYRLFCEQIQIFIENSSSSISPEIFDKYTLSLLDFFYQKSRQMTISHLSASYDYIWCFGVHSQLQVMFSYIYHVFEVNLPDAFTKDSSSSDNLFTKRLKEENNFFIPRFHDILLASAKKAVFIGCEQRRLGHKGSIEGAYQAIQDIRSRSLSLTESMILWPFCPANNISYEMLIQKITL